MSCVDYLRRKAQVTRTKAIKTLHSNSTAQFKAWHKDCFRFKYQ